MREAELRAAMCEVGRRLWQRGLVGGTEGNISARLSSELLLCTPSGVCKGHLEPADLVTIDLTGKAIYDSQPSSEIKLHTRVMGARPDCQAVVHAHPTTATAFTLAGVPFQDDIVPEAAAVLGRVVTVPFARPGTDEVPDSIEPFLASHKTFLLSHHGAVTLGKDLLDAYHRMETLDRIAKLLLAARALGVPNALPAEVRDEFAALLDGDL